MLRELPVTQPPNEPLRRWFADENFDLLVWTSEGGVVAFELCYDKLRRERALTWSREFGWGHFHVDSGEAAPIKNRTPILVSDGSFPTAQVVAQLAEASTAIDPRVRTFVLGKLQELAS